MAESVRASLRREWYEGIEDPLRRREVLDQALGHIDAQLALLRSRRKEIDKLTDELETRRRRVWDQLRSVKRRRISLRRRALGARRRAAAGASAIPLRESRVEVHEGMPSVVLAVEQQLPS
jgi:chromosome segregation ATPase